MANRFNILQIEIYKVVIKLMQLRIRICFEMI